MKLPDDLNLARVSVCGTTGSGKTTLARQIAELTGGDAIELDELYWRKDWAVAPEDDVHRLVAERTKAPIWTTDGNYSRFRKPIDDRATLVIWLDYPLLFVLVRLFRRTMRRSFKRELLWGHSREKFWRQFFSKQSILWWCLKTHGTNRKRRIAFFNDPERAPSGLCFRSAKQTEEFLNELRSRKANGTLSIRPQSD